MEIIERRLANGMSLIVVPMAGTRSVTGIYRVEAGWRYETRRIEGVAHFLEHMLFKGTERRPSAKILSSEVEGRGGRFNASTSPEGISFWIQMPASGALLVPDILADMILHPLLNPQEIEKEKGPVGEELAMYETRPDGQLEFLWLKTLFGAHQAGWTGVGTQKSIARISRENLTSYMGDMFVAPNSVLVFAGNIPDPETFFTAVSEPWSPGLSNRSSRRENAPFVEIQTEPRIALKPWKTEQVLIKLGVKFNAPNIPERFILQVLNVILGAGMSSKLFLKVREELGLAYFIGSHMEFQSDVGYFEIDAGLNKQRWQEGVRAIIQELNRLSQDGIREEELARVKQFIIGNMEMAFERSSGVAQAAADDWTAIKRAMTFEERVQLFGEVTSQQVQETAQRIFRNDRLNLAVIGASRKEENKVSRILTFEE